eukprot:1680155-Rhodomonas_salina.1
MSVGLGSWVAGPDIADEEMCRRIFKLQGLQEKGYLKSGDDVAISSASVDASSFGSAVPRVSARGTKEAYLDPQLPATQAVSSAQGDRQP